MEVFGWFFFFQLARDKNKRTEQHGSGPMVEDTERRIVSGKLAADTATDLKGCHLLPRPTFADYYLETTSPTRLHESNEPIVAFVPATGEEGGGKQASRGVKRSLTGDRKMKRILVRQSKASLGPGRCDASEGAELQFGAFYSQVINLI